MSYIITHVCSNEKCDFYVRLYLSSPIWKENTPEDFQMVPVTQNNKKYVIGYSSDHLCLNCKKVINISDTDTVCPNCNAKNFLNPNDICPKCHSGTINEDETLTVYF